MSITFDPQLMFEFARAQKILVLQAKDITLHLIGCGGTGSWLAPSVARIARLLIDRFRKDARVIFWDPDVVEEKDIYRQNFCYSEVGMNKAVALAGRYSLAWGLDIHARTEKFHASTGLSSLSIYIGCVDNAEARQTIAKTRSSWRDTVTEWWLDCGNGKSYGQIVLGAGCKEPVDRFALGGYCTWLPWPSDKYPSLLEDLPASSNPAEADLSCAELAFVNDQGLAINQRIAAEATDYLVRMLLTSDLCKQATFMDLESGTTKSEYIFKEEENSI